MADLNSYDVPLTELEQTLLGWAAEAVQLRYGEAGDPDGKLSTGSDQSPAEAVEFLRRVRQRADRVGELLAASKRARGRVRRALAEVTFAADNAVDTEVANQAKRRVEFESHRAREVNAKVANFDTLHTQHRAKRLVSVAEETVDVINDMHWSLDGIRKDLRSTLHALQFEASLER